MTWAGYPAVIRVRGGCLRWRGPHHTNGYGKIGSKKYAHRFAWEEERGPIPAGMTIDHVAGRCLYRDCVNVEHMEVVTQAENCRRGRRVQAQIAKTHCPRKHPYSGRNLMVRRGKRECRECYRIRNAANYIRRKNAKRHA